VTPNFATSVQLWTKVNWLDFEVIISSQ